MCENEIPLDTNNIISHAKRIIPLSSQDWKVCLNILLTFSEFFF